MDRSIGHRAAYSSSAFLFVGSLLQLMGALQDCVLHIVRQFGKLSCITAGFAVLAESLGEILIVARRD
jgi:hypothetical protein